ncbi:hypothetical protein SUGI_0056720 [Cryptomeria japonica]|uniref:reticulon-like protein B5 n=1 Tax=Cryptomeria japonica TaxID=3369 RepID=UPI002408B3F6|nr:reticulon-like protein B5 [Cryptomeria japonica]GLJ07057.1 hypothetical protein SUGI_0056720 [Cryptomeria japonica]
MSDKLHYDSSSSSSSSDSDEPNSSASAQFRRLFGREESMHKLLGGGKVADVLLWRNKKASAISLGVTTLTWLLFEYMEYHLLTLVSHLFIFGIVSMFVWSNGANLLKLPPPRIPEIKFSEEVFLNVASAVRVEANRLSAVLHDVASGKDLKKFVVAVGSLWILSVVGSWCNFLTLLYMGLIVIETVPFLYENHEDKVDKWVHSATVEMRKLYKAFDRQVLNKIPRGPAAKPKKLK